MKEEDKPHPLGKGLYSLISGFSLENLKVPRK